MSANSPTIFSPAWRCSRVKQLKEEPYTQKEAEAAVGLTTDNGKRKPKSTDVEMTEMA